MKKAAYVRVCQVRETQWDYTQKFDARRTRSNFTLSEIRHCLILWCEYFKVIYQRAGAAPISIFNGSYYKINFKNILHHMRKAYLKIYLISKFYEF